MTTAEYQAKWQAERERKAFLALADGTVFHGVAFGARKDKVGEVVFNTGMSGYQEILTDPSYAGQFVTLTTAEVGNYGTNPEDLESRGLFLHGLVINAYNEPSNYRNTKSLDRYLKDAGGPGIYGIEAVAQAHFHCHASELSRSQCALIAATLPNPRRFSSAHPSRYMRKRQHQIERQMKHIPFLEK